jgi:MoaA/NifB/PqqE/SkfB family radical SAM enzyme
MTSTSGTLEQPPVPQDYQRTSYAVWEITLKCNLACSHCGSRAGEARQNELSTPEALDLVRQMAESGIREVTLIGGEAYLRADWLEIAAAIRQHGMVVGLTTGGLGILLETARRMKEIGLAKVSVSVDGLEETHDLLRGKKGSWQACFRTMGYFREVGLPYGCNTQINRRSAPEFPRSMRPSETQEPTPGRSSSRCRWETRRTTPRFSFNPPSSWTCIR